MARQEKFARPKVVCAFLPTDAPAKSTAEVDFHAALAPFVKAGREADVKELCDELTSARRMAVWVVDPTRSSVSLDEVLMRLRAYGSLLRGFLAPPNARKKQREEEDDDDAKTVEDESKAEIGSVASTLAAKKGGKKEEEKEEMRSAETLRHVVTFAWRDLFDVKGRDWVAADVALEEAALLLAASQTVLSRAAREAVNDSNAVALYTSLRQVGGLLARTRSLVDDARRNAVRPDAAAADDDDDDDDDESEKKKKTGPKTKKTTDPTKKKKKKTATTTRETCSEDLRFALPEAWAQLALAEAQHMTVRRASAEGTVEWSLLASLCADEATRYSATIRGHIDSLTTSTPSATSVKEWAGKRVTAAFLSSHVNYKARYFEALARYCVGAAHLEHAIAETDEAECAQAIAELTEASKKHAEAMATARHFVTNARAVTYVDDPTLALADSADVVKRALQRAHQLNDTIFHKPPVDLAAFPAPKSLVTALPYAEPHVSPLWTQQAWDAFDPTKLPKKPSFGPRGDARDCCALS